MNEKPILFSTPMVQAILKGLKTQTRRICKIPFSADSKRFVASNKVYAGFDVNKQITPWTECPYGFVGDVLWVRESFSPIEGHPTMKFIYRAGDVAEPENYKWKPSIHMPKDAARIWLEIIDVRIERLNDISKTDARAEGVNDYGDGFFEWYGNTPEGFAAVSAKSAEDSFFSLWESINGPSSWDANPWVWVVEFKRIEK